MWLLAIVTVTGAIGLAACEPPPPPPPLPLLIVGDSVAHSLDTRDTPTYARVGCGLTTGVPTLTIDPALSARCAAERDAWFAGVPAANEYLLLSTWELNHFMVGGRLLTYMTPEWKAFLTAQYEGLIAKLPGTVYLVTVPRHAPVSGVPRAPEFDAMTPALNAWYRQFAATHPGVKVVDLDAIVCPGGTCPEYINGIQARPDGSHFSPAGAALIVPRLLAALTAARNGPPPTTAPPSTTTTTQPAVATAQEPVTTTTTRPPVTTTAPAPTTTQPPATTTTTAP